MKKMRYIIYAIIAIFICNGEVNAGSATCTYNYNDIFTVTIDYKYGIKPTSSVAFTNKVRNDSVEVNVENNDIVKNKEIKCPNFNVTRETVNKNVYKYKLSADDNGKLSGEISNLIEDDEENTKTTNKVCIYNSGNSSNEFTAQFDNKLIIDLTGEKIKNYKWEYALNSREFISDDFNNGNCPEIHIHCVFKQSVNKCYISSEDDFAFTNGKDIIKQDPDGEVIDKDDEEKIVTSGETIKIVKQIYDFIKILIPVLIILLSTIDFLKVILISDDKNYKSAWNKFIKRLIIGVIFIILPFLISFILRYSGIETEQSYLEIFK